MCMLISFLSWGLHETSFTLVKEAMEYKLERLHNFNPLDLQYTDLQQVDVLPGNPTYNKIYERLARKSRDMLST